jgi:hypothetical protein
MPCFVGCLALAMPRFAIILVVIFSDYIGRAYQGALWPLAGFLFMPLTTLAYAWAINSRGSVAGFHLIVVVIALLFDLGLLGGSASRRRQSRKKE